MEIRKVVAGFHVVLSALHVYWATGATWPASDQYSLSQAVLGREVSFAPEVVLPLAAFHLVVAAVILRVDRSRLSRLVVGLLGLGVASRAVLGLVWSLGVGTSTGTAGGGTRVALTGGIRVPGRAAIVPLRVRHESAKTLQRLENLL
jgi:hypothetical protein